MLAPRQVVDRYELMCPIGDGAMAHVWAARQPNLSAEKLVALKIVHSRFAEDASFRRMFLDEARIIAPIQHPNVAQVFDLGESGPHLFLVMEYVDGESLFSLLAPSRTVPIPVALRIAADACAGLHAAHSLVDTLGRSRDVVHRDVSPHNILLGSGGEVKVSDFGIAHARDRAAATSAGMVKGKARYMAPEQARREPLGPYTDVFGIGCTLARMITGRAPYASASDAETLQALVDLAPPLQPLPADVPSAIRDVIHRAIAPRVTDRIASARELADALQALAAREGWTPDVASWVNANLSEKTRERRRLLVQPGSARIPTPRQAFEPPAPGPAKEPGFMDVNALVARARAGTAEVRPAPRPLAAPPPDEGAAPAAEQDAPPAPLASAKATSTKDRASLAFKLGILAIALVVVSLGVLLFAPMIVRDRVLESAREAGVDLKIEGVGVGFGGITLRNITARATRTPGINATIQEVRLVGLSMKDARVHGLDARLEGDATDLQVGLAALVADTRGRLAGTAGSPRHLSVVSAHLSWSGPQGERFSAGDVGLELDSRGPGLEDLRGSIGRFDLTTKTTTLGPWAASFERDPKAARVRFMFDPPIPDGPSALVVWHKSAPTELTVKVLRSSFKNLGLKPSEIGIPADDATDVELSINGTLSETSPAEVTFDASLWGLRPKGLSNAVDVHLQGTAKSPGGKPYDLEKTTVTLGPFAAGVTGTVTPHGTALRLDAMFKTIPLPCERLAKAEAKNMGPLVATLQAFGQSTGVLRVTGAVNASGIVKYDTAEPDGASVTWLAKETCGVSIFGM